MAIFHSYVKLPEGILYIESCLDKLGPCKEVIAAVFLRHFSKVGNQSTEKDQHKMLEVFMAYLPAASPNAQELCSAPS